MQNDDVVNHPSHYTSGSIECIDAIQSSMSYEAFCGYLKGNVLKYLWRYKNKNNPVEDLEKAKWYLEKLIYIENINWLTVDSNNTITGEDSQTSKDSNNYINYLKHIQNAYSND